jgi:MFS family permease
LTNKPALGASYRWIILVAMSFVNFASYYIWDSLSPLAPLLKEELALSGADFGLLFSAVTAANVFLVMLIISGVIVDKIGVKFAGIIYVFCCLAGALLTAFGASANLASWLGPMYGWLDTAFLPQWSPGLKIMLLGRAIFGIGAEAILIVNNKVLARWFLGKELAFAYGLNLTIMRLGTYLALNFQAPMAIEWGLVPSLWMSTTVMGSGAVAFVIYLWMERKAVGREGAPTVPTVETRSPEDVFRWREAFAFKPDFWLISALCVVFYSAVFPFQNFAPDIMVQKFGFSMTKAGQYASSLILGTMVFTPIFGWVVDRHGKRATMMIWGSLALIPCHLLLGFTNFSPIILMFIVGVSLSLVPAALWAAIPMMVKENHLGTAFGVIGYIQNIGLTLFPFLAGKVADAYTTVETIGGEEIATTDYTMTMVMFAALGVVGFLLAIALKHVDRRRTSGISIEAVYRQ